MKLIIKTLQNSVFKVDIEADKTVKDLKDTIAEEQGKDYPSGAQKLIYNGKILTDETKLGEYEFDEKKFIVLMITRPPPVSKPPQASTEQTSSSVKQESDVKKADSKSTTTSTTPATTGTNSSTAPTNTTHNPVDNDSRPSDRQQRQQQLIDARAAAALADMSMGEPQIAARLAALMSQPHFRQMQDLIQQSPHLLSSTIESFAASDPEMYNFISENPDTFVSALNHPPLAGHRPSDGSVGQQRQGGGVAHQGGGGLGILGQQPIVDQLLGDVTEHDKEAIERLKELGFSEYLAVQAYMACDKDEQLAANLLFQMEQ